MAESEGGPGWGRALRIGGLAVAVVVAVVLARARAAGLTPPVQTPTRSATEIVLRLAALAVMVAAVVMLLWGRRLQRVRVASGNAGGKRAPAGRPSRRVLIACLIGLLFALGMQLLGNAVNEQREAKAPPPPPPGRVTTSPLGREQPPPQAQAESSVIDEVVLLAAMVTLGVLLFVLVRRDTIVEEETPEEDAEQQAMARAVQAGRDAVLNRAITDPREAIVACFAAMEAALADLGGAVTPQDADTPEEVLRRGIEAASLPDEAASTLLRLFREARYSTHLMDEQDRADADTALGALLRSLGAPAGQLSGDPR